jgi:hypothetical protein
MAKEGRCQTVDSTCEVREMRNAEKCLAIIRTRGERRMPIDDLYRQLFNPSSTFKPTGRFIVTTVP